MKILDVAKLAVASTLGLSLAGCSISLTGNLGVTVHNSHVEALVLMCPDVTSNGLTLQKVDSGIIRWFDPHWSFPAASTATVDLGPTKDFLKVIGGGGALISSATSGVGGSLDISPKQLRGLAEGEVLSSNGTPDTSVEDHATFEKKTAEMCALYL